MPDDQQQWTSTDDQAPPPAPSGATGATGGGWSSTDDHAPDPRFSTAELGPYFQPDFETTVYGKMPPPEPDDFVHNWMINPFKQTAASLAEAHANAAHLGSNIAGFLDNASNWVHQKTGLPYGHSMQYVKNMFDEMHNEAQGVATDFSGNRQDTPSRIVRGIGNVAFNLPAYVLATQTLGPMGGMAFMGGLENLDKGAGATLQGAAEGGALGAAMWVMGPMGRLVRLNGNALLNYFYSKYKGADDDTALMNAGIGGVVGMLPAKTPYPEWLTGRFKIPPLTSEPDIQSQQYMNRLGIETPYWMSGKSPAAEQFGASVMRSPGGGYLARQLDIGKQKLLGAGESQAAELGPAATEATAGAAVKEQLGNVLSQQKAELGARLAPETSTPLEAGTAVQQRIAGDLENTKQTIANQVHPQTQTPETAGQKVLDIGKAKIRGLDQQADAAYNQVRKAELHPQNAELVPMRDKDGGLIHDEDGKVVQEKMALPIDMSDVQQALIPLARRYEYTLSDTDARASLGLKTMRNIIAGPSHKPLSAAELDRGMLIDAAKSEKGLAELRDQSAGLAAASVAKLTEAINAKAATAAYPGWDGQGTSPVLDYLRAGRKATAQKYDIGDAYSDFGNRDLTKIEPTRPYTTLTWGRDAGIQRLRNIANIAPDAIPAVGRAFIDSGGDVNQLGPETRKILFRTPEINQQLDQYQAAKTRFAPLLRQEPVAAFNQLTQPGGRRINLLSDVAKAAPEQIPAIARAFIDNDGNWKGLDPQTKLQLARDPKTVSDLDAYADLHEKYGDLHKMEPVDVFNRLTAPGGRRLEFLNDVALHAPEQMPLVARAYFEGLLKNLTRKGDIANVESTINSYLDMDAHTKRLLVNNPGQVRDWNSFFFALRRMMHNPNPSGSGFMMGINQLKTAVAGGLGAIAGGAIGGHFGERGLGEGLGMLGGAGLEVMSNAVLARMMYNKAFIRMVTRGIEAQNRGDLPASRLAARTAADMLNNEPPEDPHGGPPSGGGSPTGPAGGGKPPSLRDIASHGFAREGEGVEAPIGGMEWDERSEEMARRGITNLTRPPEPEPPSTTQKIKDFAKRFLKEEEGTMTIPDMKKMINWAKDRIGRGTTDPPTLRKEITAEFGKVPRDALMEISGKARDLALKSVKLWQPGMALDDIHPLTPETIPKAGAQLSKEDVISYLDKQVKQHVGEVPFDAPPKVKMQRLMKYARKEMTDQLAQPDPKLDFYITDTPQADADMIQMFPELGTDPEKMTLMKAASAVLAQGSNPEAEAMNGGRAYAYYRKHGRLPEVQPDDGIPGQNPGKQWSTTSGSDPIIKLQGFIDAFKSPADPTGLLGLEKFLKGRFTVATLKQLNSSVAGAANDIKSGSLILGPKIGSYYLDIAGIPQEGATVDMWDALGQYRRLGSMYAANGKPLTAPRQPDRPLFMDVHRRLENEFDLKRTQSQSGLWHYEKDLYRRLGVPTPVKGRSDGTQRLLDAWGFQRQNIIKP